MKHGTVVIAALVALAGATLAGDVDIRKARDTHVTVWRTLLGFRVGDPVYEGDLLGGHRLRIRSHWLTDLSVKQDRLDGLAVTEHQIAAMEGPPGMVHMADLDEWVRAAYGEEVATVADFGPAPTAPVPEMYVAVDLAQIDPWRWYCPGEIVMVFEGQSPDLPGYQFGLVPFEYVEGLGWMNPMPYTGETEIVGEFGLTSSLYPPNGCNPADLAPPYGILDLSDVNMFIMQFVDGCPPDMP